MAESFTRLIIVVVVISVVVAICNFISRKRTGKPFIVIDWGTPQSAPPPVITGGPVTLDNLQGRWRMVEVGKNGRFSPVVETALSNFVMEIAGDRFSLPSNEGGRLHLDNGTFPTAMDQIGDDGDIHRCIARLIDGQLEICQGDVNKPRPKDFSRSRRDDASLVRFSRGTNTPS
jgi:uncharacterized protein (TIGR03067 family)